MESMKRFVVGMAVVLLVVAGMAVIFFFGIGYYLSPQSKLAKVDAIVAISGGETGTRTEEAIKLYKEGWAPTIIFSGAALDPNSPSNAQAMSRAAQAAGVPASAIELDELAANTRGNAAGVGAIIRQNGYQSIILVTSPYHQRRADLAFRHVLGSEFTILNHSSFDAQWRRSHWWATPRSQSLTFGELQKVFYELLSGQPE
jgi:uncharacterized SAM-binding protein YcdF (DUF218 family)